MYQHWARHIQCHSTESPQTRSSSHTCVETEAQRGKGTCSRSLEAREPELGPGLGVCFPSSSLSLQLPARLLRNGHFTSHFTLTSYKWEGLLLWKTKSSSKIHKKKSAAWWGISEKDWHPSQALDMACDKCGIPIPLQVGCSETPASRRERVSAPSLPSWRFG